ncbi:hypothetical protein [Mesorhizobium sp. Z1-4]|uniref:hypothetical protein n=1 Tax=Mesorhizobium sp. Z1-4 TaxID=2448478 RepID=UPI000FD8271A|nr:hypothetical protein [Mesorhizobium sp. Z1-4]
MKNLLERYLREIPRVPDGGGSGEGAAAGGEGGGEGGSGDGGNAGGGGEGGAAADGGSGDGGAAQPYRPQGLPETMFGKDDRETMDKMATALNGYRTRESQVGKDADAYKAFDFDKLQIADDLKPHMDGLAQDPIMEAAANYALENKMPVPMMQGLVATVYGEAMKAGVFEGFVDVNAERAALLPESAKSLAQDKQDAAIDARMQANEDWVKLNTASKDNPNGMPQEVADHMLLMLMDTAKGNQAIEWMKSRITGAGDAQPNAGAGHGPGQLTAEKLRERSALPQNNPGPQFDQKSYDELQADYRKLHGE